jgi:hypothetical protein
MRFRTHPVRILSLVVLLAVTNVYVFANGALSTAKSANDAGSAKVLLGKLITMSNRPILVNGGEAITGTTILSGAHLITPAAGLATVQLDNLGTVMVAPSSNVTIAFDAKSVTVNVASGDATLTTSPGVKGTVIGPDGTPAASAPSAPAPAGSKSFDKGDVAGVVLGGAGLIIGIVAWSKANKADDNAAAAAAAAAAALASANAQIAALKACLAGQTTSPIKLCTSF